MLVAGKMDNPAFHNEHDIQDYEWLQRKGLGGFRVIVTMAVIGGVKKAHLFDH